jgi:acyl-CoA synthetase (AMP-forming)/AMP-acid ligase II
MPSFSAKCAAERPTEIALRDGRDALPWAQVDEQLNRVANALHAADLGPKRRIAVFSENGAPVVLAHIGGLVAGCSTVPVNFHLTAEEAAYILEDSRTQILFVGPENARAGVEAARKAGVPRVVGWRCDGIPGVEPWSEFLAASSPAPCREDHPPRPNMLYTSGTTGRPKGTELPPTMFAAGATIAEHVERLAQSPFAQVGGPHLIVGPLYHTGPLAGSRSLAGGTSLVILGRFDAEAVLRAIQEYRCVSSVMVPTHFVRLLQLPDEVKAKYDLSSFKLGTHTGAKCPVDVKRKMIEWFGPVFVDAYGATEVGTTCSINSQDWLRFPGSVGKPIPPFSALIVDDDGKELPPNTEGRLYFVDATGRGIVYPNDPEKSKAAHLRPGVFTLGEVGYVNEEGFVFITDRFSDMVVSGGANLYPAEAEQVLINHPDLVDIACIGIPHAEMGEEMIGLAIRRPGGSATGPEIVAWCRERLSHYKCPKRIEFVADLGRTAAGKINKKKLREPYWRDAKA